MAQWLSSGQMTGAISEGRSFGCFTRGLAALFAATGPGPAASFLYRLPIWVWGRTFPRVHKATVQSDAEHCVVSHPCYLYTRRTCPCHFFFSSDGMFRSPQNSPSLLTSVLLPARSTRPSTPTRWILPTGPTARLLPTTATNVCPATPTKKWRRMLFLFLRMLCCHDLLLLR